jgi:3-deoxy-manno-octulosonate cytidylyltransferase (CMP-KDO synthetase)
MTARVVAIIPARYESTRFPGKALAEISGKPMIQHVYERAARAQAVSRVVVATDDRRIQSAVESFGGEVAWTKSTHESGTDRVAEVAAGLTDAIIVNVQGDVPFLEGSMIDACITPLGADAALPMSTVKTRIDDVETLKNPNVVKVVCDRDGNALYFSRSVLPHARDGRVDFSLTFKHIGLYAYRRDFLLAFARLAPTPLERAERLEQLRALEWGYRIRVTEVPAASIEVDTPADLERARAFAGATAGAA